MHSIFPNAKFIYIFRDGRDAAYSVFVRSNSKANRSYESFLKNWNRFNTKANEDCERIGREFCYRIRYEKLVTNPRPELARLMKYLDLDLVEEMFHHDMFIKENKLRISKSNFYKNFPTGKITSETIGKWKGKVREFENSTILDQLAPMLKNLNYY